MLTTTTASTSTTNRDALDEKANPRFGGMPLGFEAGDANLYRYVSNKPTMLTDPSGLQPSQWEGDVRRALDISGSRDAAFVRAAIASLDTTYRLTRLPVLAPNTAAPAWVQVRSDNTGMAANNPVLQHATVPILARINLRVNLVNIKQGLVDGIYNMVVNNPPAGRQWNEDDRGAITAMANRTADDLIRMVDLFLRTHPGSRPSQGTRPRFGITIGDRFSHPWCADWAEAMATWTSHAITSNLDHPANQYIQIRWGQCNNNGQHNFMVINPVGYNVRLSQRGNDAVDPVILLFDPWRELIPRLYSPTPLSQANGAPTEFFDVNRCEETFYRDNLRDPRFREPNLNLGPRP